MAPPSITYDLVGLLALVGGVLFSNTEVAQAVAPYAAIAGAALLGGMWALARHEEDEPEHPRPRRRAAKFLVRIVGTALIVTVPIAAFAAPRLGVAQEQYLFAPLALLIGAVGDDWRPFLDYCLSFFLRWKSGKAPDDKTGDKT